MLTSCRKAGGSFAKKNMLTSEYLNTSAIIKSILTPLVRLAMDITVSGRENVPVGTPFILISNHRTDMDPLIIADIVPRYIAWIADSFLFNIPVIGNILASMGTIPISSGRKDQLVAFKNSGTMLNSGGAVGIFPEGHDTILKGASNSLGTFHSGFAEMALRFQAPVLPVTIIAEQEIFHPLVVPDFIKNWLSLPPDVAAVKSRTMYRKVHVKIDPVIPVSPYLSALPAANSAVAFKSAVRDLVSVAHRNIAINLK